jgi:hypothetical protein
LIVSTLALLCCSALTATAPTVLTSPSAVVTRHSDPSVASTEPGADSALKSSKPDAPTPKFNVTSNEDAESSSSEIEPASAAAPLKSAVKPATPESYETSRQRKIWYGLMAASHGAAAFDAWTTRRAISGGYGTEGDPLQRPFANSGAIYATTQVVPALMDFLGHRMMRSENPTLRKFWWIPQAASTSVSLGAGIHNYRVVH